MTAYQCNNRQKKTINNIKMNYMNKINKISEKN